MDLTGTMLGAYRVVSKLGEGGMAVVYEAYDPDRQENVAVKVMAVQAREADAAVRRFEREVAVIRRLRHPHILPLYDWGNFDGHPYFVMPKVSGGTIEDRLRGRPLSLLEAGRWVAQIAEGLDHAHARGIVHRDLKPANVLLDGEDRALLSDFGIAKVRSATTQLTSTGAVFGTPLYMSPEQVMGKDDVGPLSDVYSLGIVAYQMLTGVLPFTADTPVAIGIKHLNEPLPPVLDHNPGLPPAVQSVLSRVLAKDPDDRFAGAGDFADSFVEAVEVSSRDLVSRRSLDGPVASPTADPSASAPTVARRRPVGAGHGAPRSTGRGASTLGRTPVPVATLPPPPAKSGGLWKLALGSALAAAAVMAPLVLSVLRDAGMATEATSASQVVAVERPEPVHGVAAPSPASPPVTVAAVEPEVAVEEQMAAAVRVPPGGDETERPAVEHRPTPRPTLAPSPLQPTAEEMAREASELWLERSRQAEAAGMFRRAHGDTVQALQLRPDDPALQQRAEALHLKAKAADREAGIRPPSFGGSPPGGSGGPRDGRSPPSGPRPDSRR